MDDTQPQTAKPISDDQELSKVLAGVTQESDGLGFEETPAVLPNVSNASLGNSPAPETPPTPAVGYVPPSDVSPNAANGDMESIKKDALIELRPLVDKLDLAPEEKFDIYLLLLRSTDDKTLIASAHTAARNIPDETKRAQALLDVIKEIDYLSSPQQPAL